MKLMGMQIQFLEDFPRLGIGPLAKDAFQMCLLEMGDCWKRFVHDLDRYPFKTFCLLDCSTPEEVLGRCAMIRAQMEACSNCIDVEFTAQILAFLDSRQGNEELLSRARIVQEFLMDIAIFVPISSDQVECCHGFHQNFDQSFPRAKTDSPDRSRSWALGQHHFVVQTILEVPVGQEWRCKDKKSHQTFWSQRRQPVFTN